MCCRACCRACVLTALLVAVLMWLSPAEDMQTFCEAKGLLTDMYACFRLQSTRMHVTLLPKYINNIKAGITEQLNVQVGLYSQKWVFTQSTLVFFGWVHTGLLWYTYLWLGLHRATLVHISLVGFTQGYYGTHIFGWVYTGLLWYTYLWLGLHRATLVHISWAVNN